MKTIKRYGITLISLLVLLFVAACFVLPLVGTAQATPRGDTREKIGSYTGPIGGAAQDDNIKASLDLAHTDLDAILADTAAQDTAAELQVMIAGGYRVASVALTALATADDLFAVSGGPIIIRDIIAVVQTGGMVATACELHYNIDPTAPATDTAFATDGTSLEINGDAEGSVYVWDGVVATDLAVTTNGVVLVSGTDVSAGLLCPIGMIETVASATNAGDITFYLVYSPLSPDSVVTPQ